VGWVGVWGAAVPSCRAVITRTTTRQATQRVCCTRATRSQSSSLAPRRTAVVPRSSGVSPHTDPLPRNTRVVCASPPVHIRPASRTRACPLHSPTSPPAPPRTTASPTAPPAAAARRRQRREGRGGRRDGVTRVRWGDVVTRVRGRAETAPRRARAPPCVSATTPRRRGAAGRRTPSAHSNAAASDVPRQVHRERDARRPRRLASDAWGVRRGRRVCDPPATHGPAVAGVRSSPHARRCASAARPRR